MKNILLLVDVQNDFCDPKGNLYIPGAYNATRNLEYFLEENLSKFSAVVQTFDWHPKKHISFHTSWRDKKTKAVPLPFTNLYSKFYNYLNSYPVEEKIYDVYPEHCLQHSWGAAPPRRISELVSSLPCLNLTKGTNTFVEEYSAFTYQPPPTVLINDDVDNIYIAGQASTHCVYQTVKDLLEYVSPSKIILLKDCMCPIKGFEYKQEEMFEYFGEALNSEDVKL